METGNLKLETGNTVNVWDLPVPEGYIRDSKGNFCHESQLSEADRLRSEVVIEKVQAAFARAETHNEWIENVVADVYAFCQVSAERFSTTFGEGNSVTLQSFCGRFKIMLDSDDTVAVNESVTIAKQLLDECMEEWMVGGKPQAVALLKDTFRPGRNGAVSIGRLMVLLSHRHAEAFKDHEKFQLVCNAIEQSIQKTGKRRHVRFYMRRTPKDKWVMAEFN